MGLDISHNAWHGAYSAFMRWRIELAKVAGFPPLQFMEGFYNSSDFTWSMNETARSLWNSNIEPSLPISWDLFKDDILVILLYHSDCDGIIGNKDLLGLAERLKGLLDKLPKEKDPGHIGDWREKTQQFIDGCLLAYERGEDLDFH